MQTSEQPEGSRDTEREALLARIAEKAHMNLHLKGLQSLPIDLPPELPRERLLGQALFVEQDE